MLSLFYRLWCIPIRMKSKYFPWVLLAIFCLFSDLYVDLFAGLTVGYINLYGWLRLLDLSVQRAKTWETRWPFKIFAQKPCKKELK